MQQRMRILSVVGMLALALTTLPLPAAQADELPGVRRVSCPSPATVNALTDSFDSAPLGKLAATPTTCDYWSAGGGAGDTPVLRFRFLDPATTTPAEAQ